MKPFRHILAATDFSGASMDAVSIAGELAVLLDAKATLLHAYDPTPLGPAHAHLKEPWKHAQEQIEEVARAELEKSRGVELSGVKQVNIEVIAEGSAAVAICDFAEAHGADLVVVGTHGKARLTRWLIGGVAEKVVRRAPCSVLAVRPLGHGPQKLPRSLLVGTDFSPAAEPALDLVAALAEQLLATVTLVYCYDAAVPMLPAAGAPEDLDPEQQAEHARADLRLALAEVAAAKFGRIKNVRSDLLVSRNPAAALCNYADEHDVGLIVVGAQGRTGHDRQLIGGVAEKVLRHAPCSVMTVRPTPRQSRRPPPP